MTTVDPLQLAAGYYSGKCWVESDWRHFGRETGTSDILLSHPRLYRSLDFGDDDYPDVAFKIWGTLLRVGVEPGSGESGRMEFVAESIPDLPSWMEEHAPPRSKRIFLRYLAGRAEEEIPVVWRQGISIDAHGTSVNTEKVPQEVAWDTSWPSSETAQNLWPQPNPQPIPKNASQPSVDFSDPEVKRPIFIVHGQDTAARDSVRIFIHSVTDVMPTVLAELPAQGRTIIEKFESEGSRTAFVVVLLTPDDVGNSTTGAYEGTYNPRARQNVIFELGYFIGKLGRENVVIINAGVEQPSDIAGYNYIPYPGDNWQESLRRELTAGYLH